MDRRTATANRTGLGRDPGHVRQRELGGPPVEEDVIRLIVLVGLTAFVIRALIAGLREPHPDK
jgi:hypothetical protein